MEQFKIKKIFESDVFGLHFYLTNSSFFAILILLFLGLFFHFATRKKSLVPSRSQLICEGFYNFTLDMIGGSIHGSGSKFLPVIFSLFVFILTCNLFGMIPYSFTVTSHVATTLVFAVFVFFTVVGVGIAKNGLSYINHFVPSGIPKFIVPLMFVIELFSFLVRPFTLAVRLAANMTAGHTVLKVIATFVGAMGIFGVVPLLFLSVLTAFEIFVSLLQAYIFSLLACVYINEAFSSH
jgi:F-type H+-transporting ATPase subunit a